MNKAAMKIYEAVRDDLDGIETALRENLKAQLEIVEQTAGHILFSGGKRLRPLLFVLCARLCGYSDNNEKPVAGVFEYLHVASLLHDDLVDEASLRRGKPVAHSVYGNSVAVLVGDFLLARSLSIISGTGRMKIVKLIGEITENLTQGEIDQLQRKGDIGLSETEYMAVIRRKTAILIQGACQVGAVFAGASEDREKTLAEYGLNLGIAFQMADDLLDFTADTKTLGKEIGADLREGKLTLPVIHALGQASATDREQMVAILKAKNLSEGNIREIVDMLRNYGSIAYTESMAGKYVEKAKAALSGFAPSKTLDILLDIADYVLYREK